MSICKRCGAEFHCAMADGNDGSPCWCTAMPPAFPVPSGDTDVTCWCPACLKLHIEQRQAQRADTAGDSK
ncbi:hypothetical protein GCM10027277_30580 [Pseudoduganella ginsengisoli]|uniref:Cysteine-rich CWC family protein n=1 Tax=Pseudoduganella ginsengisoli TaxID=1462440 RepID=A0A6L6PZ75_9BURK|nr:cysteine-rich CWC family protein [Pseudoduganella ginsengisoli]MTW02469.1 hypothetical protein [Pseudoduganella ginsengisoli]